MEEKDLNNVELESENIEREPETNEKFFNLVQVELTDEEKEEFEAAMRLDISSSLKHPLTRYKKEETFLRHFFMAVGKYKKVLSYEIIEKFYDRYYSMHDDLKHRSRLNNKMISVLYAHKRDDIALRHCIKLCKKDMNMNIKDRNLEGQKLPSLKKMITIDLYLGKYQAAVNLCDMALSLGLVDAKNNGYEERKRKILLKMGINPDGVDQSVQELQPEQIEALVDSVDQEDAEQPVVVLAEEPVEEPVEEPQPEEEPVVEEQPAEEPAEEPQPEEEPVEEAQPEEEQPSELVEEPIDNEPVEEPVEEQPKKNSFKALMMKRVPTWIGALIILALVAAFCITILVMLSKAK